MLVPVYLNMCAYRLIIFPTDRRNHPAVPGTHLPFSGSILLRPDSDNREGPGLITIVNAMYYVKIVIR